MLTLSSPIFFEVDSVMAGWCNRHCDCKSMPFKWNTAKVKVMLLVTPYLQLYMKLVIMVTH